MLTRIQHRKIIIAEIVLVVEFFLILADCMSVSTLLTLSRGKILLISLSPCSLLNVCVCAKGSALTIYRNLRERSVEISCSIDSAIRQERSCSREPKR